LALGWTGAGQRRQHTGYRLEQVVQSSPQWPSLQWTSHTHHAIQRVTTHRVHCTTTGIVVIISISIVLV